MTQSILKKATLFILVLSLFVSCSSDDDDGGSGTPTPEFAMTFKIDGELFELNNPFGTNEYSQTNIFSAYPLEDFVLLQSRNGLFGLVEVDLWLKRDQIIAGTTYQVNMNTDESGNDTHIDLIDNRNNFFEGTTSGEVSITSVNTNTKVVKGTFNFIAQDSSVPDNTIMNVTEGTFNYIYED